MTNQTVSENLDVSGWKIIYPAYLDKMKTISKGRIVASVSCVENPTVAEIAEICIQLGIPCRIERKRYPKDHSSLGRVRYQLFDKDGNAYNSQILTKKLLLNYIGKSIPELKSRKERSISQNNGLDPKDINCSNNTNTGGSNVSGKNKMKKKK